MPAAVLAPFAKVTTTEGASAQMLLVSMAQPAPTIEPKDGPKEERVGRREGRAGQVARVRLAMPEDLHVVQAAALAA